MSGDQTAAPIPRPPWFYPAPGRLLVVLLAVEAALFLFESWMPKGWAVLIAVAAVGVFLLLMLLWYVAALLFRWRFQFSIRSLLVLTVAVAVPFSWLAGRMKQAKGQREVVEFVRTLDGYAIYEYNRPWKLYSGVVPIGTIKEYPDGPLWLQRVFGRDFFNPVWKVFLSFTKVTDSDLARLERYTALGTT